MEKSREDDCSFFVAAQLAMARHLFYTAMLMDALYPIFLNLTGKKCLVLGLGQTGCRKLKGLLSAAPAEIIVLDLRPASALSRLARRLLEPPAHFECRSWNVDDLKNCFLAFACTDNVEINSELANACAARNIPCNCVVPPRAGSFQLGARAMAGKLQAALSSSGCSPMLVARMKAEMEIWLRRNALLASFMGSFRIELLKFSNNSEKNREYFAKILDSQLPEWLNEGRIDDCQTWLRSNIPFLSNDWLDKLFLNLEDEIR